MTLLIWPEAKVVHCVGHDENLFCAKCDAIFPTIEIRQYNANLNIRGLLILKNDVDLQNISSMSMERAWISIESYSFLTSGCQCHLFCTLGFLWDILFDLLPEAKKCLFLPRLLHEIFI